MSWKEDYQKKLMSVEDAAAQIKSGDRVWLSPVCSMPIQFGDALAARYKELENATAISGLLMHPWGFLKGECKGHINYESFFLGPVERKFLKQGNVKVTSVHFSHIEWYTINRVKANVAVFDVTPPDEYGYMSFGPLGTYNGALAAQLADKVIVQVNKKVPYVYGGAESFIHVAQVDHICEADHDIPVLPNPPLTDEDRKIGAHIAERVPDGACLQLGIGGVANAVGELLVNKKDLGVHTEMFVDSMVTLAKKGVINCSKKNFHPGKITAGFGIGSKELYDFMDRNQLMETFPIWKITDPYIIGQNDNFVSINSCLTVDITGQVGSEALGFNQFSGTGGQLDFVRGAGLSKGGMSFIALASTVTLKNGTTISKIVTTLEPGTAVTTPRTDVQYIVTEYGVADLRDKSIPDRAKALIAISHPDFRDQLQSEAKKAGVLY